MIEVCTFYFSSNIFPPENKTKSKEIQNVLIKERYIRLCPNIGFLIQEVQYHEKL